MIKTEQGRKVTAKQAAALELYRAIENASCCADRYVQRDLMTEKESEEYIRHLEKFCSRLEKVLGHE